MDFNRIKLLFDTIKYLKFKQISYRLLYAFKRKFINKGYSHELKGTIEPLKWSNSIKKHTSYLGNNEFSLINITHKFHDKINWNFDDYGKLWTYNLNYFDFLNQTAIRQKDALMLLRDYVENTFELKDGLEPYPISLRGINWIKYLSKEKIRDGQINKSLYNQYLRLLKSIEYHLLGNHLLENGFSLLFGAYYFKDDTFYSKAKIIIKKELNEQILRDGAHFELSPMYHQIILDRLLDCIYLLEKNPWKGCPEFLSFMKLKAGLMVSWLDQVTFSNGSIPMVNDSTFKVAPETSELIKYAEKLAIQPKKIWLSDSGYRKFIGNSYELFADVGEVGPIYQPGHAHADTFSFVLHSKKPLIVDPAISTYNMGKVREEERASRYHNTVTVNCENSSKVWAGFRVANRANVTIKKDEENELVASHNGYKNKGVKHTRSFRAYASEILICDSIGVEFEGQAHFHFHPDCKLEVDSILNKVTVENITITFIGAIKLEQYNYFYSCGYNRRLVANKIKVTFLNNLKTNITVFQ